MKQEERVRKRRKRRYGDKEEANKREARLVA